MEESKLSQVELLVKLGECYVDDGFYEFAIDVYTEAINLEPRNIRLYNLRGIAYGNAGEYNDSIADFNVFLAVVDDKDVALGNRGVSYRHCGMCFHAIDDFNAAIELCPDKPGHYLNRGLAWFDYAESDESSADESLSNAIADFSQAILLGLNKSYVFEYRGEAYLAIGDVNKALDDFNRAEAIDPSDIDTQVHRILALRKNTERKKEI